MNKAELIETISGKVGVQKRDVENVIDTMTDVIVERLKSGDEVTLTGFGAFSARTRKGRIGVNPRNPAEQIQIPSVVVPKFKAGKNLKEALKSGESKPQSSQSQQPADQPTPSDSQPQM